MPFGTASIQSGQQEPEIKVGLGEAIGSGTWALCGRAEGTDTGGCGKKEPPGDRRPAIPPFDHGSGFTIHRSASTSEYRPDHISATVLLIGGHGYQ